MPWNTVGGGLGNLPPETRGFVGRETELGLLAAELTSEKGSRLLSLVGVGGVGKTRLALHTAARVQRAYPDGVWLVELSALHTDGLVPLAVMEALRLADQTVDSAVAAIAAWARDKRLLLILDSCEHLPAECGALAVALTDKVPGLRVLATSRVRLGAPGEWTMTVEPLPVSGAGGEEGAEPAVADTLFAQRAAGADPGLVLDAPARRRIAAICRGLDGIPLAIELAAARLSDLGLDELHTRLGADRPSRLDLLTSQDGDAPARHRALRTTIGWSHELCAPLERLLWARLSVFAGGFDTEAATFVCAGGPLPAERVGELIEKLVAWSIVRPDRTDPARYRMLDTVREYGGDWLRELGEEEAVRLRHRDHYRRLARQGWAEWNTGRQVAWAVRVLADRANLHAALDFALAGPDRAAGVEMAGHVGLMWRHCGVLRDARHFLDRALAGDVPPGPARTRALWACAAVAVFQGDLEEAANLAVRCADSAREEGDAVAQVAAVYLRGTYLVQSGRMAEAIELVDTVPRLPVQPHGFGAAQLQIGLVAAFAHLMCGEFEAARAAAVEVRRAGAECGECWAGSVTDYLIAQIDLTQGDAATAVRGARTAIAKSALMHDIVVSAVSLDVLAAAVVARGDGLHAARLLGVGSRIWELTGGDQLNSPDLIAARRTHELRVRGEIGHESYETAFAEGRAMSYEEGLRYAARSTGPQE
ncbi:NB-ARC domain-containing protein [Streptomyces sp. NPDC047043]|uniref:ATP-binding protein n=1 Tax=Streptomyces sp. NPDC047043 TaxID=3154497 RepID=UPI0033CF2B2F